jgi:hypothetical protein
MLRQELENTKLEELEAR